MGLRLSKKLEVGSRTGVQFPKDDAHGRARSRTQDCARLAVGVVRDDHQVTGRGERAMTPSETPYAFCGERRGCDLRKAFTGNAFENSFGEARIAILADVDENRSPQASFARDELGALQDEGPEALQAVRSHRVHRGRRFLSGNQTDENQHSGEEDRAGQKYGNDNRVLGAHTGVSRRMPAGAGVCLRTGATGARRRRPGTNSGTPARRTNAG